jgi:hypothetical protein
MQKSLQPETGKFQGLGASIYHFYNKTKFYSAIKHLNLNEINLSLHMNLLHFQRSSLTRIQESTGL